VDWCTGLSGVPPDNVRCTRAVQVSTSYSRENAGAIHYNSLDCPVSQRATAIQHATVNFDSGNSVAQCTAEVRAAKSEGTVLSGVAPDCPVPQEDKAPMVNFPPNPNSWVTWWRTGQRTVPIRWHTGLSGTDIANSLPNGYLGG
jgi:hypothetical protein